MSIKLNFINRSNDANNSQIVIFQKNVATDFDELSVAWHVIQNCGVLDNHPFTFPMSMKVSASDSWGNYMPQVPAENGQMYHVEYGSSGDTLSACGAATSGKEVQVRNDLNKGAINASIYKDGRLLALKTNIAPNQKAVFEFKPTIWIGVVSQVTQGEVMNSAIMSDVNTELSLLGIISADIVMTGGGPGKNSTPFKFTLENIQRA
jgi:hypothetical protein